MTDSPDNAATVQDTDIDDLAAIQRGADAVAAEIAEALADDPQGFVFGSGDYDAAPAMADLFGYCLSAGLGEQDGTVPAELRSIIARLGDASARLVAEMNEEPGDEAWAVRITRADGQVINVGPYSYSFHAQEAASYFRGCAHSVAGAEDAQIKTIGYDETQPHRAGTFSFDPQEIAVLMGTDDSTPGTGDFPDLYARVAAFHGDGARGIWVAACDLRDAETASV